MMIQIHDAVRAAFSPLQLQLLALAVLALAASTALAPRHAAPQADYAVAHEASTTPYGSGAALRNLLF